MFRLTWIALLVCSFVSAEETRKQEWAVATRCLNRAETLPMDNRPSGIVQRFTHRGAFQFGGGAHVPVWRFFGLRGEVHDFYTGSPTFNAPGVRGGQHNVVVSSGFVLSF